MLLELLHPTQQGRMVVIRAKANQSEEIEHILSTLPLFDVEIESGAPKRRISHTQLYRV